MDLKSLVMRLGRLAVMGAAVALIIGFAAPQLVLAYLGWVNSRAGAAPKA